MIKQAYINGFMRKCAEHRIPRSVATKLLEKTADVYKTDNYGYDGSHWVTYTDDR